MMYVIYHVCGSGFGMSVKHICGWFLLARAEGNVKTEVTRADCDKVEEVLYLSVAT